jgi:hypothetical protein
MDSRAPSARQTVSKNRVRFVEEFVSDELDPVVSQTDSRGPRHDPVAHRPDLREASSNFRGKRPTTDDAPSGRGTHDMQDKMLAQAYRRGLRVKRSSQITRRSLEVLFGGEC